MAKIPDFGGLTKKLDIQGLLDSVKSAVGGGTPPKAPDGDEIAAKFVEIITAVQNLATAHAEQAKTIASIHSKLNTLYREVQAFKAVDATVSATPTSSVPVPPPAPPFPPDDKLAKNKEDEDKH